MIPSKVMAKMATLGLSEEQAVAVASMLTEVEEATAAQANAAVEASKAKVRARVQKWRETHQSNVTERNVTLPNVTKRLVRGDARGDDKTSNLEIEPQKEEKEETRASALAAFWSIYPHRVGKADAAKALERALKRATLDTILAGLRRYAAKTDDRPWCNPSTWLNQDRWTDEPAAPVARAGPPLLPSRINPTLASAFRLKDEIDAVSPSEIEGNHPPPRLVAIGGRGG